MPNDELIYEGSVQGVVFRPLVFHSDARGWLCELFRSDELDDANLPQMAYVSETLPGVVRGPHEHAEQSDFFAFLGPGDFQLCLWDNRPNSPSYRARQVVLVGESNRQGVIIPPGVVHAYQNVSDGPAWVFNAPNRLFAGEGRKSRVDEIRHEDDPSSPYAWEAVRRARQKR